MNLISFLKDKLLILLFLSISCISICFFINEYSQKVIIKKQETKKKGSQQYENPKKKQAEITIKNIIFNQSESNNQIQLSIKADVSNFYKKTGNIFCQNITCNITEKNKYLGNLKAIESNINQANKTIFFPKKVSGNFSDVLFYGSKVFFDYDKQLISSNNPIQFIHDQFYLSANKVFFEVKNKKIILTDGVRTEFFISPGTLQ